MSHPMALPTVTAALRRTVLQSAASAVQGASVRLGPPTARLAEEGAALVNLHLYRVAPNAANANAHLPSRRTDGTPRGPSELALDLSYVLSFYGNAEDFEPERMLSEVVLGLEDRPVLGRSAIEAAIADAAPLLDASDLAEALARVRLTREMMSLDEVSKLWSIFYQVPYAVSVAYTASHVRIETAAARRVALPVADRAVFAAPIGDLRIDTVSGAPAPLAPVLWDAPMVIAGRGLARPGLGATLGGRAFDLSGAEATPDRLTVTLEAARLGGAELPAGAHALQLFGPLAPGAPEVTRPRSNATSVAIAPMVTPGAVTVDAEDEGRIDGALALSVAPGLAPGQAARLLLDPRSGAGGQIALPVAAPETGEPPATALEVPFEGLPSGDYLVRLEVDGYASPVILGTDPEAADHGQIVGPVVSVP